MYFSSAWKLECLILLHMATKFDHHGNAGKKIEKKHIVAVFDVLITTIRNREVSCISFFE